MGENEHSTKDRLIQSACEVFAAKGFRDATVAEICEAADANIAAVNYHFRDKETLYDAVWHRAFEITSKAYPIDGGLPDNPTLEDYLYCHAHAILHRIFSEDETGLFAKLLYREMAAPTLALEHIAEEVLFPQTQFIGRAVASALGENVKEEQLKLCMHSIVGQCAFYNFGRALRERVIGKRTMSEEEIERIAHHIARFSLGGLEAIKESKLS